MRGYLAVGAPTTPGVLRGELPWQHHGAIQLPSNGQPIVLMPDHGTIGGYRVVAVVIAADLGALAYSAPGTVLRFATVSYEIAAAARAQHHQWCASAVLFPDRL